MAEDADDASAFIQFDGMPPLSPAAIQLHGHGIVHSINDGYPGFVSDDYLNAIRAETTVAAAELEAAGMWSRRDGGYFIVADEMVGMLIDHNEEMDRLAAACEVQPVAPRRRRAGRQQLGHLRRLRRAPESAGWWAGGPARRRPPRPGPTPSRGRVRPQPSSRRGHSSG